jgi:hypothetical protein
VEPFHVFLQWFRDKIVLVRIATDELILSLPNLTNKLASFRLVIPKWCEIIQFQRSLRLVFGSYPNWYSDSWVSTSANPKHLLSQPFKVILFTEFPHLIYLKYPGYLF